MLQAWACLALVVNERHIALLRQLTHSVQLGVFASNQVIYLANLTRRLFFCRRWQIVKGLIFYFFLCQHNDRATNERSQKRQLTHSVVLVLNVGYYFNVL